MKIAGRDVSESFFLPQIYVANALSQNVKLGLGGIPQHYLTISQDGSVEYKQMGLVISYYLLTMVKFAHLPDLLQTLLKIENLLI